MPRQKRTNITGFHMNVKKKILNGFRKTCVELGVPMGVVIETFMKDFTDGKLELKIGKNDCEIDIEEE